MSEIKKVTLEELIQRSLNKKKGIRQKKEIFVKSLEGKITIEEPEKALCVESFEQGDAYLLYNCVVSPNLKDSALHKAYGVVEPIEIVEAVFKPGEIYSIAQECMKMAGYEKGNISVIEEVKN